MRYHRQDFSGTVIVVGKAQKLPRRGFNEGGLSWGERFLGESVTCSTLSLPIIGGFMHWVLSEAMARQGSTNYLAGKKIFAPLTRKTHTRVFRKKILRSGIFPVNNQGWHKKGSGSQFFLPRSPGTNLHTMSWVLVVLSTKFLHYTHGAWAGGTFLKGLTKCTTNGFVRSLFSDVFLGYLYIKNSHNPLFFVGVWNIFVVNVQIPAYLGSRGSPRCFIRIHMFFLSLIFFGQ